MGKVVILRIVLVFLFSLVLLFPTYWMITGSVQPLVGILRLPPELFPRSFSVNNYKKLFEHNPIGRWTGNTLIVATTATVVGLMTAAMAGYAFSLFRFPGRRILYWAFIASIIIPSLSIIIPQFVVMRMLGLARGLPGAILPLLYFPGGIVIFRLHVDALPLSIHDAARIDGAGEWQIFTRLILPLCTPALGLLTIGKAGSALSDFMWQSLILTQRKEMTLLIGLVNIVQERTALGTNPIGMTLATGTIMMLPMLVVFIVFQRSFRYGLLGGATKE